MGSFPHLETDPWSQPGPVQLVGPVGASLGEACYVGLELAPADMPMVLAGVARLLAGDRVIYCADGANRFDPYRFSHWARACGLDPAEVLSHVLLSRAFTVHQMAALAMAEFPRLVRHGGRPLLVILGLEELFLDEQIPRFERDHLFGRILLALEELRSGGGSLLVTMGSQRGGQEAGRVAPWLRRLRRSAEVMTRLRHLAGGTLLFEETGRNRRPTRRPGPLLADSAPFSAPVETEIQVFL